MRAYLDKGWMIHNVLDALILSPAFLISRGRNVHDFANSAWTAAHHDHPVR